ncbi:hypothetical protein ABPG77_010171 [Micractinium sp. CCAP 211/92]
MGSAASTQPADLPTAINTFGSHLFDHVAGHQADPGDGLFLSPYGIAQALAMVLNGAEPGGESYRQLQSAVYGGGPQGDGLALEALNAQLKQLSASLVKPPSEDLTVSDANSAWLAQRYQLLPEYAQALKAVFGTAAQPLTSADAVNSWVLEATHGKIKSIVDQQAVAKATLILINAIYFKGLWLHQFKKTATHGMDFYPLSHSAAPRQVAAMFQTFKGPSAVQVAMLPVKAGGASFAAGAVQLPYRGGEYYAVVAAPRGELSSEAAQNGQRGLVTPSGLVPYGEALTACRQQVLANLPAAGSGNASSSPWSVPNADVKVFLPRQAFEIEYSTSLSRSLQALGIRKPFEGGDLTRIAAEPGGAAVADLQVSDVVHKVYAKVDEEGTEAAAATAVIMVRSMMPRPRDEIELRFDRPFAFAVVHGPSGLALFSGEVHSPEEWNGQA